jgi:antitoxin VapB
MDTVEVVRRGTSVTLKVPASFDVYGDRYVIHRQGRAIVLLPADDPWRPLLDSLGRYTDDFMEDRNQPDHQARAGLDG